MGQLRTHRVHIGPLAPAFELERLAWRLERLKAALVRASGDRFYSICEARRRIETRRDELLADHPSLRQ